MHFAMTHRVLDTRASAEYGHFVQGPFRVLNGPAFDRSGPIMAQPHVAPLAPSEARQKALAVIQAARFPFLATIDGNQPRLRPVSPVKTDGFTIYVANLRRYGKTAEIAANARVELGYLDANHDQVRITGIAETVTDRGVLQAIWDSNPLLRQYLGSLDNPELIVYCVRPNRVRFMREWALDYHEVPLGPDDHPAK
jgi:general stress protein 26